MRLGDLAVVIHEEIGAVTVQHARGVRRVTECCVLVLTECRGPNGFDRRESRHRLSSRKGWKQPHRIGAAADAGDQRIRQGGLRACIICARVSLPITHWKSRTIIG